MPSFPGAPSAPRSMKPANFSPAERTIENDRKGRRISSSRLRGRAYRAEKESPKFPNPRYVHQWTLFSRWEATKFSRARPSLRRDEAPVPQIKLGLLAKRLGHIARPRAHLKAEVKRLQGSKPTPDGIDRCIDAIGQSREVYQLPHLRGKGLHQHFQLPDVLDTGEVANILPNELLTAQALPAGRKAVIRLEKRLGEAAERQQKVKCFRRGPLGILDRIFAEIEPGEFGQAQRVHAVWEISSHQAVPAALVNIQARAADDDYRGSLARIRQKTPSGNFYISNTCGFHQKQRQAWTA